MDTAAIGRWRNGTTAVDAHAARHAELIEARNLDARPEGFPADSVIRASTGLSLLTARRIKTELAKAGFIVRDETDKHRKYVVARLSGRAEAG